MIKTKHGWFAACVAVLVTLVFYLVLNDRPISHHSDVPAIESSGPLVSAKLPKTMVPTNPFQQKLDEQEQHLLTASQVLANPNAARDPFKEFLEKQSETVYQSPFVK